MFFATLLLSPLFTDHLVLQRDQANPVWGKDDPQQIVTLTVEGTPAAPAPVQVVTSADGTWKLACPELPAGGPYRLRVKGSTEQVIDDVLVGEVWLASGQSNMEWKLPNTDHGAEDVASANDPELRMFNVDQTALPAPRDTVSGQWARATPQSAAEFSAIGYLFAKELRRKLRVPVGIINTSWGGTRVEAWASREALRAVMPVEQELAALAEAEKDLPRIRAEHQARVDAWERSVFPIDTANTGRPQGWATAEFDDSAWPVMALPVFWQNAGLKFNGCVWFRHTLDVPAEWAGHDLTLNLGVVDDFDTTYFNGQVVGVTPRGTPEAYKLLRRYVVPGSQVKAGKNVIAVRVFDQFGEGGFSGPRTSMFAESAASPERLPLAGEWRYQSELEVPLVPGSVYATSPSVPAILQPQNNPAYLFNGMIAPLAGYGIRGAIWYQGEANVDVANTYRDRFTAMIRDWRARWGQGDFPFYFVQLANFTASPGWPFLREAQTQTLAEPQTGMVVTLDIGNPADIHPRNKREVARRLALLARDRVYGEAGISDSGPTIKRVAISGGTVCLHWRHAKGLSISGGADKLHGFELAGADGVYHPAEAHIDGETVVVTSAAVPAPRTVRYAWADNPQANLENAAGLPAAPFRTDTFPVSMNTSPSVTAPAWEKSTWQGEPAWASIHGPVRAIVSEARARLIYLGAADGSYNLLNAPAPRPAEGQNQGGHRFWLGPQYRWVWPPLKEWEFSAAAQVSTRADGTLVVSQPQLDKNYPALTREYAWEGDRLRCTVRWQSDGRPYFGLHVIPVDAPMEIQTKLVKWDETPHGIVNARMVEPVPAFELPHPAIAVDGDTATLRSGIQNAKLGFAPQSLTIARPHGWTLSVAPGPYEGVPLGSADQGYLSQVWVGDSTQNLAELEQLTPYLVGDADGHCASSLYLRATAPAR